MGTIITVVSLQRLKMEALIPAPADREVRSMIKFVKLQKFQRSIQNKRRGMLSAGVVLLHDNARSHKARRSTHLLLEFSWEVCNHPPYSPDLAPSDFHLFLRLKKFLSCQRQRFQNVRGGDECHTVVPIPGGRLRRHRDTKVGPKVWQMSQFRRWICLKIATLSVSVPIHLSIILGFFCKRPQGNLFCGRATSSGSCLKSG